MAKDINELGFRTAIGGFHKGDVTAYLTKLVTDHQEEIANLNSELDKAVEENKTLYTALEESAATNEELLGKVKTLEETISNQSVAALFAAAMPDLPPLTMPSLDSEPVQEPVPVPQPVSEPTPAPLSPDAMELAAYRRAEATERIARQRAKKMYESLENIRTDAQSIFSQASDSTRSSIREIEAQLSMIHTAFSRLQELIDTSTRSLDDMGATIPDPLEGQEEF